MIVSITTEASKVNNKGMYILPRYYMPRGGLGIFTDRDQRSIFGAFEFRKSVFFLGTGHSCCISWVVR